MQKRLRNPREARLPKRLMLNVTLSSPNNEIVRLIMLQRWEYKTITVDTKGAWLGGKLDAVEFDRMLNELGHEGWELVSTFATNKGHGESRHAVAVFKRPYQNEFEKT